MLLKVVECLLAAVGPSKRSKIMDALKVEKLWSLQQHFMAAAHEEDAVTRPNDTLLLCTVSRHTSLSMSMSHDNYFLCTGRLCDDISAAIFLNLT